MDLDLDCTVHDKDLYRKMKSQMSCQFSHSQIIPGRPSTSPLPIGLSIVDLATISVDHLSLRYA